MLVIFLLVVSSSATSDNNIFCPESKADDISYSSEDIDFGLNIYSRYTVNQVYAQDCYLRHSLLHTQNTIPSDFIDVNANTLVVSHGWDATMDGTHLTTDRWDQRVLSNCVSNANIINNNKGEEECEPSDHDAKYWTENGWNVIMLDWKQFADELLVKDAEAKIYTDTYQGQTVVELLYDKLVDVLDITGWNGEELRFAGHSLGAQIVMNLASKFKLESSYKDKLTRIALLDHWFSEGRKDYLQEDPNCVTSFLNGWNCRYSTGTYATNVLLANIRSGDNAAVIENYRTSPLSTNPFVGDVNEELNERTVFTELKAWFYGSVQLTQKHNSALVIYLHCMKFVSHGNLHNDAPSCRMDTTYLKNEYCPSDGTSKCITRFEQIGDDAARCTWDYDDQFTEMNV